MTDQEHMPAAHHTRYPDVESPPVKVLIDSSIHVFPSFQGSTTLSQFRAFPGNKKLKTTHVLWPQVPGWTEGKEVDAFAQNIGMWPAFAAD